MNLLDIDWSTNSITGHQYPRAINDSFISMMEDVNIKQLVDFPTRMKNILDIYTLYEQPILCHCCEQFIYGIKQISH